MALRQNSSQGVSVTRRAPTLCCDGMSHARISQALGSRPTVLGGMPTVRFPTGGDEPIPLPCESELLQALRDPPFESTETGPISDSMNLRGAYTLTIFSVRMAVLAARTGDPTILLKALPCLA